MGNVHFTLPKRVVNKNKNKTNLIYNLQRFTNVQLQIFYNKEICKQSCNIAIKCIDMSI